MKFAGVLKSVAVASALAASSASFAAGPYTFVDGTTSLTLSQDILSVYDLLGVSTVALAGSTSTVVESSTPGSQGYLPVTISQPTTSEVFSGSTIISGNSVGSGVQEVRGANVVTLQNFVLDNTTKTLYADITAKDIKGVVQHYTKQAFLVAGPTSSIDPGAYTISSTVGADGYYHATGSVSGFILDGHFDATTKTATGALNILAVGLGVKGVSIGAADNVVIGSLDIDSRFSAPAAQVPEPSTYAMLIAGVAGVGFMARRRKAA